MALIPTFVDALFPQRQLRPDGMPRCGILKFQILWRTTAGAERCSALRAISKFRGKAAQIFASRVNAGMRIYIADLVYALHLCGR